MEAFGRSHRIDGGFHRFSAGLGQGFCHITNTEADQGGIGMGCTEGLHTAANFWEKISSFEFEVIAVDLNHRETDFWGHPATYDAVSRVGTS